MDNPAAKTFILVHGGAVFLSDFDREGIGRAQFSLATPTYATVTYSIRITVQVNRIIYEQST